MRKLITIVTLLLLFSLLPVVPVLAQSCRLVHAEINPALPYTYTISGAGCVLCQVTLSVSGQYVPFAEDGCQNGYCVVGVGTQSVTVTRDMADEETCPPDLIVKFYSTCNANAVVLGGFAAATVAPGTPWQAVVVGLLVTALVSAYLAFGKRA